MMTQFYTAINESILTRSIITWFSAAVDKDKAKLQRVIWSAERVIGVPCPPSSPYMTPGLWEGQKDHGRPLAPRSRPLYPSSFWEKVVAA